MDAADLGQVALAHDYLNQRGGAERVALEFADLFPRAPLYTSLFRPASTFPGFADVDVRPSPLDRLPVDRSFRNLAPLYPVAFRAFAPVVADLLLSSSSAFAHHIRAAPGTFHAVYCHTPARWMYGGEYLGASSRRQRLLRPALAPLRRADRAAARAADLYIANSENVRGRIRATYGHDAAVVPPPVAVERYAPTPRGERLLMVSRALPYKRLDVVVRAASQAGIGLDVVGVGPHLPVLKAIAGPHVTFHGTVDDAELTRLMQGCRAYVLPGEEDFGMTPVEAQAAGKPVVAFAAGGALETVEDGLTGVFFERHEPAAVLDALRRCDSVRTAPGVIAQRAARFSRERFRERLLAVLGEATGRPTRTLQSASA
jgi:glycosyltransferase involved in cell wall biosynthesis